MTDGTGTTTRAYDQLNRTKTKTVPNIGTMTFLYDVTTDLPSGQTAEISTDAKGNVTTNVYDKAGRLISVTAGGSTTTYTYYNNGSKHQVIYPNGSSEEYTYYDDNQLYTLVNKKADQTVIDSYAYTYDAAHNLSSKVDSKGTTSYTYDDLERLLTVTEPSARVTSYAYDAAGNRENQTVAYQGDSTVTTYTYNNQNRLTGSVTKLNNVTSQAIAYAYDNNGNQLTVTTTPYVNGIPGTPTAVTCSYDTLNRLITTTMPGIPEKTVITNTYNGEGIRVAKTVNGIMTRYLYEGNDVVLELDSSNNQIARNVWGTSLICRNVSGTMLYYMYNGHADVTALIDDSGTILATYYYDAFGNITESTGTANNPFKYGGYQYDSETGYYYMMSRYYDPVTARFITEDTYRGKQNDPLSLNLYTYCANNPLIYWDPDGHDWVSSLKNKAASAASGVKTTVNKGVTAVKTTAVKAATAVKTTVTNAATAVKTTYTKATVTVKAATTKATNTVKSTVTKATGAVKTTAVKTATVTKAVAASTYKTTVSIGNGVFAGVKSTGNSIISAASNPVQTGKALVSAAANPVQTANAVKKELEKTIKKDIINGNAESRAKVITEAVLSIAGTKGISKISSVASVASKAKKVEAVAAVASKAETVAAGTSGLKGAINSVSNRIAGFWADESGAISVGANVSKGASEVLNPKDIHFMQSSIKDQTGNHTVLDNIDALKNGTLKPEDLPTIKVWKDDADKIWTLDHRRLAGFKGAELDSIPVQWATPQEVADQMWKMTTKNGGISIKLKLGNGQSITIK